MSWSPSQTFAGQIDGSTLTLSAGTDEITATATADGVAIAGRWIARSPCCDIGPFTGLKQTEHGFDGSATGDWNVTLASGILPTCEAAVEQSPADEVFVAFDCGLAGGYWLRGPLDSESATFELVGIAGSDRDLLATARGVVSEDGQSFAGTIVARYEDSNSPGSALIMEGRRIDDSPNFMDVSGDRTLRLITQYGEEVSCSADVQQLQEVLDVPVQCEGVGGGILDGWLSPLTGELNLEGSIGNVEISFQGDASEAQPPVMEGRWTSNRRFVEGCFTTSPSIDCQAVRFVLPGDANCDDRANSLDAAIVLQVVAGFVYLGDLCDGSEGVHLISRRCCPVTVNAVDAAIILQISAGLFARLAG